MSTYFSIRPKVRVPCSKFGVQKTHISTLQSTLEDLYQLRNITKKWMEDYKANHLNKSLGKSTPGD